MSIRYKTAARNNADGQEWESIPLSAGLVRNVKTGKILHEQHFMIQKQKNHFERNKNPHRETADLYFDGTYREAAQAAAHARPPASVIHLRCHDIHSGVKPKVVDVPPGLVFRELLDLLKDNFGKKTLFEYQHTDGKLIKVHDDFSWEHFCDSAHNTVLQGREPTIDVFICGWTYEEPVEAGPLRVEDNVLGGMCEHKVLKRKCNKCSSSDTKSAKLWSKPNRKAKEKKAWKDSKESSNSSKDTSAEASRKAEAAIPEQIKMQSGGSSGGFSALSGSNLFVKQTRRGCLQELIGCDAKSEFLISTLEAKENFFLYALENSSWILRFVCGSNRPWEIIVSEGSAVGGADVARFKRPLRLPMGPCKCCCFQEVLSLGPEDQPNGLVREKCYIFVPQFQVIGPGGDVEFRLSQPTCFAGFCVNIFAEGLCNCRIPFYLFPSTGGTTAAEKVGSVTKVWSGLGSELFTDADKFEVGFPPDANTDAKARILGSLFLINQLFFESQENGLCGNLSLLGL